MNDANCSISIPGYRHNGDCNLICKPTEWTDIATFFLGNYVAHAATVIGRPGQSTLTSFLSILIALCLPGAGVLTGIQAILSRAAFAPTELVRAARAGALCIVVKGDNGIKPQANTSQGRNALSKENTTLPKVDEDNDPEHQQDEVFPPSIMCTKVHGVSRLPAGYRLLVLPSWTEFVEDPGLETDPESQLMRRGFLSETRRSISSNFTPRKKLESSISCSYNAIKILISLGQLLFAAVTLFQTRGNQIEVFGSAAFGLTVAPYVWMSFVNLLGNLLCPQYETMFVVNSPTLEKMKSALKDQGTLERYPIDGAVGRISEEMEEKLMCAYSFALQPRGTFAMFFGSIEAEMNPEGTWFLMRIGTTALLIAAVPIGIVGGMSGFRAGSSTTAQRVWTLLWLLLGPLGGVGFGILLAPLIESRPALWRRLASRPASATPTIEDGAQEEHLWSDKLVFKIYNALFVVVLLGIFVYCIPAIGGSVVVGNMLKQYGTCMKLN